MHVNQSLPNKKYKVIFFDFGDTLAFNNQTFVEGLHKILKTINIIVHISKLKAVIGMADSGILTEDRLKARNVDDYRAFRIKYYTYVLNLLGYPSNDNKYPEYIHNMIAFYHQTYLKPESVQVLSILKENGYKLGIISNFSHSLPRILNKLGIADKFDFITYSDDVGYEKPLPYIFEDALSKADVKPEECIHIQSNIVHFLFFFTNMQDLDYLY